MCARECMRMQCLCKIFKDKEWTLINFSISFIWFYEWKYIYITVIWKLDLTDKMKRSFFPTAVVLILLYGCTTWTLTKRMEKKLDGNYTRMLRAILNKSWRQHLTKHLLCGHLPPISKTIKVRRTRHAGYCWRSRDELISDALLWIPLYGRRKAGQPARTYMQQLCEDTGCSPEDLPEAMDNREEWRETVKDIRAGGTTWWWWWWWWYIYIYIYRESHCLPIQLYEVGSITHRWEPNFDSSVNQIHWQGKRLC